MKTRSKLHTISYLAVALIALPIALLMFNLRQSDPFDAGEPLTGKKADAGVIRLIGNDFSIQPLSDGWAHRTFWNVTPTEYSLQEVDGRRSLHCRTDNSGSILARNMRVNISDYPILNWEWKIEEPITSDMDEESSAGDDHPARLFLRFTDKNGTANATEIIWSNTRFQPGDYKIIEGFHHLVANGLNINIGTWHQQSVDLEELYQVIAKNQIDPVLTVLGFFCDSDNTGGSSSAYFQNVNLQARDS